MNFKTQLFAATVLATLGTVAVAQEGMRVTITDTAFENSRASVRAEALVAANDASLRRGEAAQLVLPSVARSSLSRAQVQAEAREAQRLGLIQYGEGQRRLATTAESEQIRQAGLRAGSTGS